MKKMIVVMCLLLCLLLAVLYWFFRQPEHASEHTVLKQSAVLSKIRELNHLQSTAFYLDSIIRSEKQGNWFALWQDSQKGIFVVKGSVKAGLDLNKIRAQDVSVLNDVVIINLPSVEVLSVELKHIEVYDIRTGTLNLRPADMRVLETVQKEAKKQILQQACQNGLLEHAQESSRQQLQQLFALANIQVSLYSPAAKAQCVMPKE